MTPAGKIITLQELMKIGAITKEQVFKFLNHNPELDKLNEQFNKDLEELVNEEN